jgi:very-short-patch-repair endonuclease
VPKTDDVMLARARSLRNAQTPAEAKLWSTLRGKQLHGFKFARQVVIGRYIVDFVARSAGLVIEVDGHEHGCQVERDAARTGFLEQRGYRVIRFTNAEVLSNVEGVATAIVHALTTAPHPGPLPKGERG